MDDCNHEEADTRIMVHIRHALEHGAETVLVRTIDTDVFILVGLFFDLVSIQPSCDFWIAFGIGKNYRLYHINSIYESLGEPRSRALPVFHAFSGCDSASAFNGKGKKSLWQAWQAYDDATETFACMAKHPLMLLDADSDNFQAGEVDSHTVWQIESFVLCQWNTQATLLSWEPVNGKTSPYPRCSSPTCQAVYQAGIWISSTNTQQALPSPRDYGWMKEPGTSTWVPVWMTIPEVSRACRELIKCCCKGACTTCKCTKANLPCSPLCKCKCWVLRPAYLLSQT